MDLMTRYGLRKSACGCSLRATPEGPFVRYEEHREEVAALIARLRAAEAWADALALQAYSMATAIEQGDEDGELDALGPVTAAIVRSDVARMLEIIAERPLPEPPR